MSHAPVSLKFMTAHHCCPCPVTLGADLVALPLWLLLKIVPLWISSMLKRQGT